MLAVGAAILLAGYGLAFWGNRIRTGNRISLADALIPGHFQTGPLGETSAGQAGGGGRTIIGYSPAPGGVGPPSPIYGTAP